MNAIETFLGLQGQWVWLILAAMLAIAEVAVAPGIFLIFIAIAAALTGFATMIVDFSVAGQFIFFAIASLAAVYGGRHWYASQDTESSDPMLNNRGARMIGKTVTVVEPLSQNGGRVRVGDGEWPARGDEMKPGTKGRITAVTNGTVEVEAID